MLNVVIVSLPDDKAVLATEEAATLATIGANVAMWVRDLRDFPTEWMGGGQSWRPAGWCTPARFRPVPCCTYVAEACGTGWDRTGRHGTRRDNDSKSFRAVTR